MNMPMSQMAEFKGRKAKNRFKPQPSNKSCSDCTANHTLEAQLKGTVCHHECHSYGGY